MVFNSSLEELLLRARKGDELAQVEHSYVIHHNKRIYIASATGDMPYKFNQWDEDFVFESTYADCFRNYEFQSRATFVGYFVGQLKYSFQNLHKSRGDEFQFDSFSSNEVFVLSDSNQKDSNDFKSTVIRWDQELNELGLKTGRLTRRDIAVATMKLSDVKFVDIAEKLGISLSTAKKSWKKYLDYAREIYKIEDLK